MEKFEALLTLIEKLEGTTVGDLTIQKLQTKAVECRTEFNLENADKRKAQAQYAALLEISKLMFESFANRVNNGL